MISLSHRTKEWQGWFLNPGHTLVRKEAGPGNCVLVQWFETQQQTEKGEGDKLLSPMGRQRPHGSGVWDPVCRLTILCLIPSMVPHHIDKNVALLMWSCGIGPEFLASLAHPSGRFCALILFSLLVWAVSPLHHAASPACLLSLPQRSLP